MMSTPFGKSLRGLLLAAALSSLTGCAAIKASSVASEGNRQLEKKEIDQAIETFRSSLELADNGAARAGLAEAYIYQGRYAEAEVEAKRAVEMSKGSMDPNTDRFDLILAKAYLLQNNGRDAYALASNVTAARFETVLADPASKKIVRESLLLEVRILEATAPDRSEARVNDPGIQLKYPDDKEFKAERSVVAAIMGRYDEAIQTADLVLASAPGEGDALLGKGLALMAKGQFDDAKGLLQGPLKADPTRVLVAIRFARDLEQKNPENTIKVLEFLRDLPLDNFLIHERLGILYWDNKRLPESIKEHEALLKSHPTIKVYNAAATIEDFEKLLVENPPTETDRAIMAGYLENVGNLYMATEQYDLAIDRLERSVRAVPKFVSYQVLASAYDKKEMTDKAIVSLEKAMAMDPSNTRLIEALGKLYFKAQQPEKALATLQLVVKDRPNDPEAHLNLGVVFYDSKQYADAVKEFQASVDLKPDNVDAWYYLGIAQVKAGMKKEAKETLLKVVQMKPDFAEAYRELGNLALEVKSYKEAEKYYKLEDKYRGSRPPSK